LTSSQLQAKLEDELHAQFWLFNPDCFLE
jgi:hypothetical protein